MVENIVVSGVVINCSGICGSFGRISCMVLLEMIFVSNVIVVINLRLMFVSVIVLGVWCSISVVRFVSSGVRIMSVSIVIFLICVFFLF